MEDLAYYFFNREVAERAFPYLVRGLLLTLEMAVYIVISGLALGIILASFRAYQIRPLNAAIMTFVDVFRALPPLVVIVVVFFALPYAGIQISPFMSTVITLALIVAATSEEIFWSGITSVPGGQWQAGRASGLGFGATLVFIVIPQAVRMTIAPVTNKTISITKHTALGSVVSVEELLAQATQQQGILANPTPLTMGAIGFLIVFAPLVQLSRWIERRYSWQH